VSTTGVTAHIDKIMKEDKRLEEQVRKVLLLGTGESGKSTILKQMKIVYDHGFSDVEKETFIPAMHINTLESMQALVHEQQENKVSFSTEEEAAVNTLVKVLPTEDFVTPEVLAAIQLLWKNDAIRTQCAKRASDRLFRVVECAPYLFDNASRFWAKGYVPTESDILRVRLRTTGIVEKQIAVDKVIFRFVDMGGQKTERRKWISRFDDVTAVLFVVAISEYNQVTFEDKSENRLADALEVFQQVLSHQQPGPAIPSKHTFDDAAIILFLNKVDLFRKKVLDVSFTEFFPEYKGPDKDVDAVAEFIKQLFLAHCQQAERKRQVFVHFTCATDTEAFRVVFESCKEFILQTNLHYNDLIHLN